MLVEGEISGARIGVLGEDVPYAPGSPMPPLPRDTVKIAIGFLEKRRGATPTRVRHGARPRPPADERLLPRRVDVLRIERFQRVGD